jgi:hypothetical protein
MADLGVAREVACDDETIVALKTVAIVADTPAFDAIAQEVVLPG